MQAFRREALAYRLASRGQYRAPDAPLDSEVNFVWATPSNTRVLYAHDPRLLARFSRFLEQGYLGLFLHKLDTWMSYVWVSTPDTLGPPHLARWIQRMGVYWFFNTHTRDGYRGRGLYRKAMKLAIEHAYTLQPDADVYIDIAVDNAAPRHVVSAFGFQPVGLMVTYRIPKLDVKWTRWRKDAPHPPLP